MNMNIASTNAMSAVLSSQLLQRSAEAGESGRDHDGDSDDRAAAVGNAVPTPSVNSYGQITGRVVNVTA